MGIYFSLSCLILFAVVGVAFSRTFYFFFLKHASRRIYRRVGCQPTDAEFALHEMTYCITIPNHDPDIIAAGKEDLRVQVLQDSWVYPNIYGVRVVLTLSNQSELTVAFLRLKQYRAALLDKLLFDGAIRPHEYDWIAAAHLIAPQTIERIRNQVYEEIHKLPYE